jgi:hypothetical protein
MGIVLPDGILGNPGDEPIRRWILKAEPVKFEAECATN